MASTPTTKSQVQAYRFVLRRMESALVRKDPVMLHDPMRTHKRATVVGIIVGIVGLAGFAIVAFLSPSASLPTSGVVIAKNSGQIYVVGQNPHQLIPVFNMASAYLLSAAQQSQQQNSGSGSSGSSGSSSSSSQQAPAPPAVTTVDESELAGVPVGRLTGIPDGPQELPAPGSSNTSWAVCDNLSRDENAPQNARTGAPTTSVLAGVTDVGSPLPQQDALYGTTSNGNTYLIFQRQSNVNDSNNSDVAAQIDTSDQNIVAALNLKNYQPRQLSGALLSTIPQVAEVKNPVKGLPGYGQPAPGDPNIRIGQAFNEQLPNGTLQHYVMLQNGYEQVSETTAEIVRAESGSNATITTISPDQMGGLTPAQGDPLGVASYPDAVTQVINGDTKPIMCLSWSANLSDPQKPQAITRVTVDTTYHLPTDSTTGKQMQPNLIGQANPAGQRVNGFFMDPHFQGLAVRAASGPGEFSNGPIELVAGRGTIFSVPDVTTAQVLGIANSNPAGYGLAPAPQTILSLLPTSAQTLSEQNVQRTFDSVPVPNNAGVYMTPPNSSQGSSGN